MATKYTLLANPASYNLVAAPAISSFQIDAVTEQIVLSAAAAALSSAVNPQPPTNFVITGSIQWLGN